MSAIDSLLAQLDQPDHTHVWSREDVLNARAEVSALREEIHTRGVTIDHLSAENARMREMLAELVEAHDWREMVPSREEHQRRFSRAIGSARAALGGRDE